MTHAITRVGRSLASAARWIVSLPTKAKLVARDREEAREIARVAPGPTVAQRQDELIQFYGHYEALVEILCDAANLGPAEKLEQAYQGQKRWMSANYGTVRPYVVAYLRYDEVDSVQAQLFNVHSCDAFEALFVAPDLTAFLAADDGETIARIMRTREALTSYGQHLRFLQAKQP